MAKSFRYMDRRESKIKFSRNGFTLLEMLIVITVLTTLITIAFFSAADMKATARAHKVISDMYAWKMAAIAWYNAHKDEVGTDGIIKKGEVKGNDMYYDKNGHLFNLEIAKYLSNISENEVYSGKSTQNLNVFKMKYSNKRWFVCYNVPPDPTIVNPLRAKIKSRAEKFEILKDIKKQKSKDLHDQSNLYDGIQTWMYLEVLDFNGS